MNTPQDLAFDLGIDILNFSGQQGIIRGNILYYGRKAHCTCCSDEYFFTLNLKQPFSQDTYLWARECYHFKEIESDLLGKLSSYKSDIKEYDRLCADISKILWLLKPEDPIYLGLVQEIEKDKQKVKQKHDLLEKMIFLSQSKESSSLGTFIYEY